MYMLPDSQLYFHCVIAIWLILFALDVAYDNSLSIPRPLLYGTDINIFP